MFLLLLLLPNRDLGRVERYFEGHASVRVPCIEVQVGLKGLTRVMFLPAPSVFFPLFFFSTFISAFFAVVAPFLDCCSRCYSVGVREG